MSDTANHKKAIDVLRVARKTPGLLLDVLLQVIADDPAKIVNAYEKVKPRTMRTPNDINDSGGHVPRCEKCGVRVYSESVLICLGCSRKLIP